VHEIQYSSLQDLRDVFDGGRDGINALREGIFNELGMVQDELRTIQTRLRHTQMCGNTSIEQARMDSEKAFLLNWMKEERGGGDTRVATRNDKTFEPLLTKKQKAALQRGQQPSANRRKRRVRSGRSREAEFPGPDGTCKLCSGK
jgi:hypothetical protein